MRRPALAVALWLMAGAPAAAQPVIDGLYCGSAISGGELVEVRTRFTMRGDGLLEGVYDFADEGETTSGTLNEFTKASDLARTLVWTDKYGTGSLRITFDETGLSFDGLWGAGLGAPVFRWDGKRCSPEMVRMPSVHPHGDEAQLAGL